MDEQVKEKKSDDDIAKIMLLDLINKSNDNKNSLQWQMDVGVTVKNILMSAGGYYWDSTTKTLVKCKESSLNSTGLLRLSEILNHYYNKDVIQSCTVMNEIISMVLNFVEDLTTEFYINKGKYGVDMIRFPLTISMLVDGLYLTLKRSYNDGTRVHNETIMKYVENILAKENRKKRNLLGGDEE